MTRLNRRAGRMVQCGELAVWLMKEMVTDLRALSDGANEFCSVYEHHYFLLVYGNSILRVVCIFAFEEEMMAIKLKYPQLDIIQLPNYFSEIVNDYYETERPMAPLASIIHDPLKEELLLNFNQWLLDHLTLRPGWVNKNTV